MISGLARLQWEAPDPHTRHSYSPLNERKWIQGKEYCDKNPIKNSIEKCLKNVYSNDFQFNFSTRISVSVAIGWQLVKQL